METESRRRAKRGELQHAVLQAVGAAGYLVGAMLVPNVMGSLHKMGILSSSRHPEVIERASTRLVRQGLLEWKGGKLRLTSKGARKLHTEMLARDAQKVRRWDKKWRVLIFDIPEYRKAVRRKIRSSLYAVGFARLQDSVWAFPHDCEDLITLLKADLKVGDDMLYMIVDTIERDQALRAHFKLK
jgi:CRISPR-associated endonuclease Cas2